MQIKRCCEYVLLEPESPSNPIYLRAVCAEGTALQHLKSESFCNGIERCERTGMQLCAALCSRVQPCVVVCSRMLQRIMQRRSIVQLMAKCMSTYMFVCTSMHMPSAGR